MVGVTGSNPVPRTISHREIPHRAALDPGSILAPGKYLAIPPAKKRPSTYRPTPPVTHQLKERRLLDLATVMAMPRITMLCDDPQITVFIINLWKKNRIHKSGEARYKTLASMKRSLLLLVLATASAQAAPPVLSLSQAALNKVDPDIKADHYDIARTDLNADGKEDVLALMNGKSGYVGNGGATMFVLKGTADGFEAIGSIKVVREPVFARKSVSNGFRDLLVGVSGGGATPGLSALQFDGKAYPASPGEATAKEEAQDELLFAEPTPPFDQKETLQDITFQVFSPNTRSGNRLTVTPSGLAADNSVLEMEAPGIITRMEVADINADGSPELYVYGYDGTSQFVLAWSANKRKSLSQISLPELDAAQSNGYRGGDEYAVVEGILGRRFPIYPSDNPESKPTGKTRQIQYKLHQGEAGWILRSDKVVEY